MVFTMLKLLYRMATVATLVSLPFSASALGFAVTQYTSSNFAAAQSNYNTVAAGFLTLANEDFEGFSKAGQIGASRSSVLSTKVGTFTTTSTTAGGKGNGSTAIDELNAKGANRGNNIAIRQNGDAANDPHPNGGRQNTSQGAGHKTYLDSNDTLGIRWVAQLASGRAFDLLLFTLTDPSDVGRMLTISASGIQQNFVIAPGTANGDIFNVLIRFSSAVTSATVLMQNNGRNDGFSTDNNRIGVVPLPAAVWLLLGVSGVLVVAKRRSARQAA